MKDMLKVHRVRKGYTQGQMAKLLGVNQSSYSYWEKDFGRVKASMAYKIANILGVSIDDIIIE